MADPTPDMSEELKHALGKPSTYHSGPDPSDAEAQKATPKPEHVKSFLDGLKGMLGIGGMEPVPNGGLDALNKGVENAPSTPEE
jgi:hypothetical protein